MGNDPVTLAMLLGKPAFQPDKRLIASAENLIAGHVSKRRGGTSPYPVTVDDLTTLLEEHVNTLDLYEDISAYGSGVEGLTLFTVGQKPVVHIAPELSEAENKNRLKSTLAHELGHVILHDPMFQAKHQAGLFVSSMSAHQVSYRDGDSTDSQTDLYEYQAWFYCRALLMPASEVSRLMQQLRAAQNCVSDVWSESDLGQTAVRVMATHFGVSSALARIHLLKLGALTKDAPGPSLF